MTKPKAVDETIPKSELISIVPSSRQFKDNAKADLNPWTKQTESIKLQMNPSEITTESLKEKFGHKYNEAKNTYPRIFSLNITERVKSGILAIKENETFLRNNCLDVAIWLRFSEIVNGSDSEYIFSILHNLDKKIKLLDEFNEFKFWSVEDLYK